jgi:large subunit ribosomal protein L3
MPSIRRPRRGSKAYYPRKRARRIYPRIKSYPQIKEAKPLGFAGYKAGMTHGMIINTNPHSTTKGQQISVPITILDCPPISVFGFRCYSDNIHDVFSDNWNKNLERKLKLKKKSLEEQIKKISGKVKSVSLLVHTNPTFKKKPEVFELSLGGEVEHQLNYAKQILGKEIKVSDILKEGDYVDVVAVTTGKGFQGPVKRFGIRVLGRKAQQMQRHTGSLGQTEPGKVRWTVPQAGQLGFFTRTEFNKRILKIQNGLKLKGGIVNYGDITSDALLLEGSVPGPQKRLVRLRFPIRPPKTKYPVDLKYVSLESKQGV